MPEKPMKTPVVRIVRILATTKTCKHRASLVAFVTSDAEAPPLTEKYLLSQPRISTLDIESIVSVKENAEVNKIASGWFAKALAESGDTTGKDVDEILSSIESLIEAAWTLHNQLPDRILNQNQVDENPTA